MDTHILQEDAENFYDKDELQAFLERAEADLDVQWYIFFRVLAFTGFRKAEALSLTWGDIDFDNLQIRVNKTLSLDRKNQIILQTPKTKKSFRTIDVDQKTMDELKRWRTLQQQRFGQIGINTLRKEQLVFSNYKNAWISLPTPGHQIDRIANKYQFKRITTHGFRHTHCSMLFEAGATIPQVQARLGHKDIQTTMSVYNHVTKKQKEEAVEKLAAYLNY